VFSEPVKGKGEIEFKSGVPAGSYEVVLQGAPKFFLKSIRASGASLTGRTLTLKTAPVKLALLAAEGMGEISGVVLREDKPLSGAMVLLAPADPAHNRVLFRRYQSDSDGTFNLVDIVPGQYTLLALASGWELEWTNPAVLQKFLPQGQALTVAPRAKLNVKVKAQ
jgi:hypothetical protein